MNEVKEYVSEKKNSAAVPLFLMSYTADSRLTEYETAATCRAAAQQHVVAERGAPSRPTVLLLLLKHAR